MNDNRWKDIWIGLYECFRWKKKWCISLIELIIVELLKMIFFIKMGDCVYKYDWGKNIDVFYIMWSWWKKKILGLIRWYVGFDVFLRFRNDRM